MAFTGFGAVPIVFESYPDLCDQQSLKFGKGGSAYNAISMSKPWWGSARQLMKLAKPQGCVKGTMD